MMDYELRYNKQINKLYIQIYYVQEQRALSHITYWKLIHMHFLNIVESTVLYCTVYHGKCSRVLWGWLLIWMTTSVPSPVMEARLTSPPRYLTNFLTAGSLSSEWPVWGSRYLNTFLPLSIPPPRSDILIEISSVLFTTSTVRGSNPCLPRWFPTSILALMAFRNRLRRIRLKRMNT